MARLMEEDGQRLLEAMLEVKQLKKLFDIEGDEFKLLILQVAASWEIDNQEGTVREEEEEDEDRGVQECNNIQEEAAAVHDSGNEYSFINKADSSRRLAKREMHVPGSPSLWTKAAIALVLLMVIIYCYYSKRHYQLQTSPKQANKKKKQEETKMFAQKSNDNDSSKQMIEKETKQAAAVQRWDEERKLAELTRESKSKLSNNNNDQGKTQREAEKVSLEVKEQEYRRTFWLKQIQAEVEAIERISQLMIVEMLISTHPTADWGDSSLLPPTLRDAKARHNNNNNKFLQGKAQQVFRELFVDRTWYRRTVSVAKGSHQELQCSEDRIGVIEDYSNGKFKVQLSSTGQEISVVPDDLVSKDIDHKGKDPLSASSVGIPFSHLVGGTDVDEDEVFTCQFDRKTIQELLEAEDLGNFFEAYTEHKKQKALEAKEQLEGEEALRLRVNRENFWESKLSAKVQAEELMVILFAAEFCRQIGVPDLRETLLKDRDTREKLKGQAQSSFQELYPEHFPSRIRVEGSKQKDLNGRIGDIEEYNASKGKLRVKFQTKSNKFHVALVFPADAEPLFSGGGTGKKAKKKQKKQKNRVSLVFIPSLYRNEDFKYEVPKTTVDDLRRCEDVNAFLDSVAEHQAEAERRQQEKQRAAEEARAKQEAARKTAAARAEEAKYNSYRHKFRRELERELLRRMLEELLLGGRGPSSRFGRGFFSFQSDSDDGTYYNEEEYDRDEVDLEEKNGRAARLLGIDSDASEDQINRAFRRLSLQFHPDKFRPEKHNNKMTTQEAEEHFKQLSDARDTMMRFRER